VSGETVNPFFKLVAAIILVGIAAPAGCFLILSNRSEKIAEDRILQALFLQYAPARVDVTKRVDWHYVGFDWEYGGQVCILFVVLGKDGVASESKVAMVASSPAKRNFRFSAEYPSMDQCTADFSRG
jgi:hypothetical protein